MLRENGAKMLVESLVNDVANCAFEIVDLSLCKARIDRHDVKKGRQT